MFKIDIATCDRWGAPAPIIAALSDPMVIDRRFASHDGAKLQGPARGLPRREFVLG